MATSVQQDHQAGSGVRRWLGASVAVLAGTAAFNRWSATRAERDHPPIGSFVEIDGAQVHYLDRGTGSPIVLIHGSASLIEDFVVSGLVDLLAEQHRVIALDRPGYGYSARPRGVDWTPERQAALFVDVCAALGVDRPIVVGHSWGTLPALAWALDYPSKISGIALMSGYFFPTLRVDTFVASVAGAPGVGDLLANTLAPLQTRITGPLGNKMIFSPNDPTDIFLNEMPFGLTLRPGQLRAAAADSGQMSASAARLAPRYDELDLPLAILWGDNDKLVGQKDHSAKLARQFPTATAVEMTDTGHMIHHIDPLRVASVLSALAHLA